MKKKYIFLAFLFIGFIQRSLAQEVNINILFDIMEDQNRNFFEVQKFADKYFEKVGTGEGTGYEQYKRWEFETQYWIDEQGTRLNPKKVFNEVNSFRGAYNEVRAQSIPWQELGPDY